MCGVEIIMSLIADEPATVAAFTLAKIPIMVFWMCARQSKCYEEIIFYMTVATIIEDRQLEKKAL